MTSDAQQYLDNLVDAKVRTVMDRFRIQGGNMTYAHGSGLSWIVGHNAPAEVALTKPPITAGFEDRILGPFEPYVSAITGTNAGKLYVARGRIFAVAADGTEVTISGLNTEITFSSTTKVWIQTTFTAATGVVTACTMSSGTSWPNSGGFVATDTWYQRIAEVAAPLSNKGDVNGYDRSFGPHLGTKHLFRYTHTHLRVEQRCIATAKAWVLTPA